MKFATMIRLVHFRRDCRNWIADLELEDGHTWMSYASATSRTKLVNELEAVVGGFLHISKDGTGGWFA